MQPEPTAKRFKVRKLKFTTQVDKDLAHLRFKPGDLDIVLSHSRKLDGANLVLQIFDASQLPPRKRFRKLDGTIVVIKADAIVAVCKTLTDTNEWSKSQDGK